MKLGINLGIISEKRFIKGQRTLCGTETSRTDCRNEVLEMDGYAIVRLEADETAEKEGILQQFNSYVHKAMHELSFVQPREGYFRLPCHDEICGLSTGILEFGEFLKSTGYTMVGINSKASLEGESSTEVSFAKGGYEAHVVLSTVFVY